MQLPIGHFDLFIGYQIRWRDGRSSFQRQEIPVIPRAKPVTERKTHRHDTGMAFTFPCNLRQILFGSRHFDQTVGIFKTDEKQLIAQPERKMFHKRRFEMSAHPDQFVASLQLQVATGGLPALDEVI